MDSKFVGKSNDFKWILGFVLMTTSLAGPSNDAQILNLPFNLVKASKPVDPKTCPYNADDPFSVPTIMSQGVYKGQCIDATKFRSSLPVNEEWRRFFKIQDDNVEVIANFGHQNKFWIAVIPLERLQSTIFELAGLVSRVPIYHAQIRLHLSEIGRPIRLIEQTQSHPPVVTELAGDIVYTLTGVRAAGHEGAYDPLKGAAQFYGVSYQFMSLSQGADWTIAGHQALEQIKLNLSAQQTINVLKTGLNEGMLKGISEIYNTFTFNCINLAFRTLAHAVGKSAPDKFESLQDSINPKRALQRLGLVGPDSAYPNYAEEIELQKTH